MERKGLLLVNLGTPSSLNLPDIKSYLREFLSDPRVIDIPNLLRFILVNLIIVPFRSKKTKKIYEEVWLKDQGSPLLHHCKTVAEKLHRNMPEYSVKLAMRYQQPSIKSALEEFKKEGVSKVKVFPMFPQYASATYGSVLEKVYSLAATEWNTPILEAIEPYYNHDSYINALAQSCVDAGIKAFHADEIFVSYHGLPERHCQKSTLSGSGCAFSSECCNKLSAENEHCYRRQCFVNTKLLAQKLGMEESKFKTVFQSQFGKDKWIEPYLEPELEKSGKNGVKKVAVLAPSFTADCIETIEEIGFGAKETFTSAGGKDFLLIPCLNGRDDWAQAIQQIVTSE